MHHAGENLAWLGLKLQTAVDQLLGVVRTDHRQVDASLVLVVGEHCNGLAVDVVPLGRDDPQQAVLLALLVHLVGVVTAGVPSPERNAHAHTVFTLVLLVELEPDLPAQLGASRVALQNPAVDQPTFLARGPGPDARLVAIVLGVDEAGQSGYARGQVLPDLAPTIEVLPL